MKKPHKDAMHFDYLKSQWAFLKVVDSVLPDEELYAYVTKVFPKKVWNKFPTEAEWNSLMDEKSTTTKQLKTRQVNYFGTSEFSKQNSSMKKAINLLLAEGYLKKITIEK